jgi:large subunit ribosomal protein L4
MPKKMRRLANRNALLAKLIDNEVRVVESIDFKAPKTKGFVDFLGALKIERSVLVALADDNHNARLSGRNVDDVTICRASQLTCFEMLNNRYLVIAKADLEAWLSGPSSQTGKEAKVNPMGRAAEEAA